MSEIKDLESILASIPDDQIIDRISFETRLTNAKSVLKALPSIVIALKAKLTFRGRPVMGSHGIAADFGTRAASAFADAYAAVVAGLNDSLRDMGPIPDKGKNQLLITGIAKGSFGFEFELPSKNDLFPETNKTEDALQSIQELFRVAAEGSDDDVTELVSVIHPRAVKKVSEFLEYLVANQAWCGIEFKDTYFKYQDFEQLQGAAERLSDKNIKETTETYFGEFQGVLPQSRTFEFKVTDQDNVIRGKLEPQIENPDELNRNWLHRPAKVTLQVVQVGQGRPRFSLAALANVSSIVK
jgi:hypothetical protein